MTEAARWDVLLEVAIVESNVACIAAIDLDDLARIPRLGMGTRTEHRGHGMVGGARLPGRTPKLRKLPSIVSPTANVERSILNGQDSRAAWAVAWALGMARA